MATVLVLTNMYPPHHYGGYELSCRDTVERWRARGHRVEVMTSDLRLHGIDEDQDEHLRGVRRELPIHWRQHELVRPGLRERARAERASQRALLAALEELQPDVVSAWNMGALSFGLLRTVEERDIPLVLVVCNDWLDFGLRQDPWLGPLIDRPLLSQLVQRGTGLSASPPDLTCASACFVSATVRRRAVARSRFTLGATTVVYSGIDERDFPLIPVPPRRPWRNRLLFVGRVEPDKGVDMVIRALPLLAPGTTVDVVGPVAARYSSELRSLANDLGVASAVRFTSAERTALRHQYTTADLLIFPSTWAEPFGLVPVEAMACGTPVVATCTGGSGEFLADGVNCLSFGAHDSESLAAAIQRIADDDELRLRLVRGGIATAALLSANDLADVLETWHLAAIGRFAEGLPPHRPSPSRHLRGSA